jgi:Flp pilus assembly protein TadG
MLNVLRERLHARLGRTSRDAGYILAMTALLLLPLLAFTGLAVDLGSWYARAAQIQRTTDAAALAGVAFLPLDEGDAIDAAIEVARQNGFVDGVGDISVSAVPLVGDRMQVVITDNTVTQYFTSMFRPTVSVSRSSTAEYVPPIRMGSPRNFLGTGDLSYSASGLPSGTIKENFMLAVNGRCDRGEDGDLRLSEYVGNNGTGCSGTLSTTYLSTGYAYGVTVNAGYSAGPLVVEVFDAALCKSGGYDLNLGGGNYTTRYTLRAPGVDPFSGTVLNQTDVGYNSSACSTWGNQWRSIGTITPTAGEAHVVQVQSVSSTSTTAGAGSNSFALRVRPSSGGFAACSSDEHESDPRLTQAATSISPANCPNVFAYRDLSVYADASGSNAEFFLASIGPEHSGKTLIIELFDPGEGGNTIQIKDPNNNLVGPTNVVGDGSGGTETGVTSFERSVERRLASETTPGGGWGPVTEHTVDISPAGPAAGPNRSVDSARCPTGFHSTLRPACRYNERSLKIEIELPDNIDAAYGGRTWWRIRYSFQGGVSVTDRTTWSVSVEGGPVRLIE